MLSASIDNLYGMDFRHTDIHETIIFRLFTLSVHSAQQNDCFPIVGWQRANQQHQPPWSIIMSRCISANCCERVGSVIVTRSDIGESVHN